VLVTRSAGRRLRAELDGLLRAESDRLGGAPLKWDPRELTDIEADRAFEEAEAARQRGHEYTRADYEAGKARGLH
jgi:hypothetical protein